MAPPHTGNPDTVDTYGWYGQYHGHPIRPCEIVERRLREDKKKVVFFAGDSSLDNKFWFQDSAPAVNGYETILVPPEMKQDVAYHAGRR
ncbi:hypothetical protein SO694_00032377 [Aureococcus anophagefferens]|uniref:PhoD-like phosphatase metallophosphatase domain-containing protein n=1 Tax=Aureococcus anophagefferens TaxID=44056 RepID=A0ABR1FKF5_AURAN